MTQSGRRSAAMGWTGMGSPWAERTFLRTPTVDRSKWGVPPRVAAENLLASDKASRITVKPVSNRPSRARMARRMA